MHFSILDVIIDAIAIAIVYKIAWHRGFNEGSKNRIAGIGDVFRAIVNANPNRHHSSLIRRIMKQMEELGEAAEAYLNVTSAGNGKGKTWEDVREELGDQVIVAVDCALTPTPDQAGMTQQQVEDEFILLIDKKLAKWQRNRDTGKTASDA